MVTIHHRLQFFLFTQPIWIGLYLISYSSSVNEVRPNKQQAILAVLYRICFLISNCHLLLLPVKKYRTLTFQRDCAMNDLCLKCHKQYIFTSRASLVSHLPKIACQIKVWKPVIRLQAYLITNGSVSKAWIPCSRWHLTNEFSPCFKCGSTFFRRLMLHLGEIHTIYNCCLWIRYLHR